MYLLHNTGYLLQLNLALFFLASVLSLNATVDHIYSMEDDDDDNNMCVITHLLLICS